MTYLREYDGSPAPIAQLGVSELEAAAGAGAVGAEFDPEGVTGGVGGAGHLAAAQVTILGIRKFVLGEVKDKM